MVDKMAVEKEWLEKNSSAWSYSVIVNGVSIVLK